MSTIRAGISISLRTHWGITEVGKLKGEGILEGARATMSSVILYKQLWSMDQMMKYRANDLPESLKRNGVTKKG